MRVSGSSRRTSAGGSGSPCSMHDSAIFRASPWGDFGGFGDAASLRHQARNVDARGEESAAGQFLDVKANRCFGHLRGRPEGESALAGDSPEFRDAAADARTHSAEAKRDAPSCILPRTGPAARLVAGRLERIAEARRGRGRGRMPDGSAAGVSPVYGGDVGAGYERGASRSNRRTGLWLFLLLLSCAPPVVGDAFLLFSVDARQSRTPSCWPRLHTRQVCLSSVPHSSQAHTIAS